MHLANTLWPQFMYWHEHFILSEGFGLLMKSQPLCAHEILHEIRFSSFFKLQLHLAWKSELILANDTQKSMNNLPSLFAY